jgi:hypothetical protein
VVEALHAFLLETLIRAVEHNGQLLVSALLVESLRTSRKALTLRGLVVLTRTWDLKLQTCPEKHLVEIESGRRCIESNLFAGRLLVIRSPSLLKPLVVRVCGNS